MKRSLSIYRTLLCFTGVFLITEGCTINPFQSRKTTVFGTVTDTNTNLPLEGVQLLVYGVNISREIDLDTVRTDKAGNYTITVDVPRKYHSVGIGNLYDLDFNLLRKYNGFFVLMNGQRTQNCCRIEVGSKTQFDFMMVPK